MEQTGPKGEERRREAESPRCGHRAQSVGSGALYCPVCRPPGTARFHSRIHCVVIFLGCDEWTRLLCVRQRNSRRHFATFELNAGVVVNSEKKISYATYRESFCLRVVQLQS